MPRAPENTAFRDLFAVFVFAVFSCACCATTRKDLKPRREIREETRMLWRAEIENGPIPSFMQQPVPPRSISSRAGGAAASDSLSISRSRTYSYSSHSTPNTDYDDSLHLETILSNDKRRDEREKVTPVAHSQLPRINPPINDHHPPVVSALPGARNDTAWMTLPPPTARTIRAMNRVAHTRRNSFSKLSSTGGSTIELSIRTKGSVRSSETSNSKSSRWTADDRNEKNSVRTQGRPQEKRPAGKDGSLYSSPPAVDRKNCRPLTPNAVPPQQKQREFQELRQASVPPQSPPRKDVKSGRPVRPPRPPTIVGGFDTDTPTSGLQRPAPAITNPFTLSLGEFDDFKTGFGDDWKRGSDASGGMI
ncbi:hypothetical protein RUND412_005287 [Rhizina undulata]